MRFGICVDVTADLDYLKSIGYDYVEFKLSDIAEMSEEDFEHVLSEVNRTETYSETFNVSFPPNLDMVCKVDMDAIRSYCEKAFKRASLIGGKIVVVGSGKTRMIPDGYTVQEAEKNFCEVLRVMSDIAKKYGLLLAIEPLNRDTTNYINTLADGAGVCEKVNIDNVCLLVDLFHVHMNGEDLNDVRKYGKHIIHAHIARRNEDRGAPTMADAESIREFIDALRNIGYDERITVEGRLRPDFEEKAKGTIELLKHLYT